ncbi:MAG: hypothetical protein AAGK09_02740 [Planctomycetota bacterium]
MERDLKRITAAAAELNEFTNKDQETTIDLAAVRSICSEFDIEVRKELIAVYEANLSTGAFRNTDMSFANEDEIDNLLGLWRECNQQQSLCHQIPILLKCVPFLDLWNGDFICLCHAGPLSGHMVFWPHDGEPSYGGIDVIECLEDFTNGLKLGAVDSDGIWRGSSNKRWRGPDNLPELFDHLLSVADQYPHDTFDGTDYGNLLTSLVWEHRPLLEKQARHPHHWIAQTAKQMIAYLDSDYYRSQQNAEESGELT